MAEPPPLSADWPTAVRAALQRYAPDLLRRCLGRLTNARVKQSDEELTDKALEALENPVTVDRRLRELPPAARKVLTLMAVGRQPRWRVGQLLILLSALGHDEGLLPLLTLLHEGLLYPEFTRDGKPLEELTDWLGQGEASGQAVFAAPPLLERCRALDTELPALPSGSLPAATPREADGLELPLRLAALWQQAGETPFRRTQSREFFKRDLTRLRSDPVLSSPAGDQLVELPDLGILAAGLAVPLGVLIEDDAELRAGTFPPSWGRGLTATLEEVWGALPRLEGWEPVGGGAGEEPPGGRPYAGALLLAVLLLARVPPGKWVKVADLGEYVGTHHPFWAGRPATDWVEPLLLGLAYQLRVVQAAEANGAWHVRLTDFGRYLTGGPLSPPPPEFAQTLIVQPNFEVLVFRQGLTPDLLAHLSQFADWKQVGAACQMQLNAARVYRGLEAGHSYAGIVQLLTRHGLRPVPDGVLDALKTWASKRERLVVYPSATLVEFENAEDLETALARGLVEVRLTDRLALLAGAEANYKHFRLNGSRDYHSKPDQCLTVADDGLTLTIDPQRSDLLLESELLRLAEPRPEEPRVFTMTQASLRRATETGLSADEIDDWLRLRSGEPLSPAGRLLLRAGPKLGPVEILRPHVLELPDEETAEGVLQLPATRDLIERRLGPLALVVAGENVAELLRRFTALGIETQRNEPEP